MMKRTTVGLLASMALLGSGAALAHNGGTKDSAQEGSAQTIQMHSQQLGEKQVNGTVVKSSGDELKLRTDNGIISLKVDKNTWFQDASLKRAKDVKEGQQVRTSFTVEKDTNLARSIKLDDGTGGSGLNTEPGLDQDQGGSGLNPTLDQNNTGDVTGTGHTGDMSTTPGGKTF